MSAAAPASGQRRTGPIGRALRSIAGVLLIASVAGFYLDGSAAFILRAAAVGVGLVSVYMLVHRLVRGRSGAAAMRWVLSVVALLPWILVYVLGAPTFLGVSLILAGIRGDRGCEVMALPNAVFGRNSDLACPVFSPLDSIEDRMSHRGRMNR